LAVWWRGLASLAKVVLLLVQVALEKVVPVAGVGHDYARKWSVRMRTLRREEGDPCVGRWWWVFRLLGREEMREI
jgi:hypothetical protein